MSRPSNQEWERTKWYLARSLIDKTAVLSPIPETQEPSVDSPSSVERAGGGAFSPLPDLVIEKEPNRHDEPDEYYDALEKRVVKYYRRLFYEVSDEEETNSSVGSNKREDIREPDIGEVTKFPPNNSSISSQSERQSNASNRKTESSHTAADISTNSEAERNNVIETQAQIHHEVKEGTSDSSRPGPSGASASGQGHSGSADAAKLSDTDNKNKQRDDNDTEVESEDSCDSEAELEADSNDDEEPILPDEPEIMRKRQSTSEILRDSNGDLDIRKYSSGDFAEGDERVVFARELEDAQDPAPTPKGVDEESNFEGEVELDLLMESDDGQEAISDKDEESDSTYEPETKRRRMNSSDSLEASDANIGRRSLGDLNTGESGDMTAGEEREEQVHQNSSRAERATPPTLSSYEQFIQNKLDNLRNHITEGTLKLCFCRDHVCR